MNVRDQYQRWKAHITGDLERCDGCWRKVPYWELSLVMVQVCQQTHSSPAEYEERRACESCRAEDTRDEAYERSNLRWRESHGGEL